MMGGQYQRASIDRLRFISLRKMMKEHLSEKRKKEPHDREGINIVENDLKDINELISLREEALRFYSRNPLSNIDFKKAVRKERSKQREQIRRKKPEVRKRIRENVRERLKKPGAHEKRLEQYRKHSAKPEVKKRHRKEESARRKDPNKRERILQLQRESSARLRENKRVTRDVSRFFQNWHPTRADELPERLEKMIDPPLVAQRRADENELKRKEKRQNYLEEYGQRDGIKEHRKKYFHDYLLRPEVIERKKSRVLTEEQKKAAREYYTNYYSKNKEEILKKRKKRR